MSIRRRLRSTSPRSLPSARADCMRKKHYRPKNYSHRSPDLLTPRKSTGTRSPLWRLYGIVWLCWARARMKLRKLRIYPPTRAIGGSSFVLPRSEEHTSELQSRLHLVCRLLLEKKKMIEETDGDTVDAGTNSNLHCRYSLGSDSALRSRPMLFSQCPRSEISHRRAGPSSSRCRP